MIDTTRYVNFLIEMNITETQFTFLWLTLHKNYALMYKYLQERGGFKIRELKDLEEKGYVINTRADEKGKYFQDSFEVTPEFKDKLFAANPDLMFEEFWESYPNFLFIDSKRVPTKGCNMEELEARYIKLIKHNLPLHHSIMEAVSWGKERGYLTMGILKFFESEAWNYLQTEINLSKENGELPSQHQF